MNDTIFVCGSPSFQNLQTADPTEMWVEDNGCSGTPTVSGTQADNVGVQPIPTDNSSLSTQASANGCLYEGPTTIVINGSNMTVTSPATPTGKPTGAPGTSTSNDALNDAANTANVCLPGGAGHDGARAGQRCDLRRDLSVDHQRGRRHEVQRSGLQPPVRGRRDRGRGCHRR